MHIFLWEDFIFQIENKNTKKGNAMYYPRFTKLVVNFVMDKDPSIPRRNKVNWHYARDDPMFTTINVISRNEDTQLYGSILASSIPTRTFATLNHIKNPLPHYPPKRKKSGKGKQRLLDLRLSLRDLTEAEQLKIIPKMKRQKETHNSHTSDDDEHDDDEKLKIDDDEEQNESEDESTYEEDQGNEAVEDTNTNLDGRDVVMTDVILPQLVLASGFVSNMLNPNQDTGVDDIFGQHTEATSLIDTPATAIMEPSFTAQTNRPPTPWKLTTLSTGQTFKGSSKQALVDAMKVDKILLDTYGDTVTIKRPRDGADDDQEPSAGTNRGSKRRRSGKEPASTKSGLQINDNPRQQEKTTTTRILKLIRKSASQLLR
ncbi:hypothetical protein Tco_0926643 [Tanacetum coccineum]|uniref:Uncharacterized protein n=1 Tax=Tanacetum coccineum TaxID=301880 RepID=A0ABQ5DGM8_9ASTR